MANMECGSLAGGLSWHLFVRGLFLRGTFEKNSMYWLILLSYCLNIEKYREKQNKTQKWPIIPLPSDFC